MSKFLQRMRIYMQTPFLRLYWRIVQPHTHGVKVLIEHEGQFLFIRHTYQPNFWSLPGGAVERGETEEQAVRREVHEEIGVELGALIRLGEIESNLEGKHDHVSVYRAQLRSGEPQCDRVEVAELRWFPVDTPPELGRATQAMYNRYRDANG
ncbi:MAG: NUDIX domain-containing protein [Patescibacteria group bacterium]